MGRVIYLTGAPATGKSTLCSALKSARPDIEVFSYGEQLLDLVNRERSADPLSHMDIREQSAAAVTKDHVEQLDAELIAFVQEQRRSRNIVIDSHAVTKEDFGYRIAAFSARQLTELAPDAILCLYASPEVLHARIRRDPGGRRHPSEYELALHNHLQVSVASQYGVITGKTVYVLDSSISHEDLLSRAMAAAKFTPV